MVGGTDAHAKNYSVLLRRARVALAPLYDVASYAPCLTQQGESPRSSMKVGKNWQVREMTVEDWTQVGAAFGLDPDKAVERFERFRTRLPDALADAAMTAPGPFLKDAKRVAKTIARQGHLKAVRLPRASSSGRQ